MTLYIKVTYLSIAIVILCASSCKKFIEVESPYTSLNGENVYTTDATAISAITSMYTRLGYADGSLSGIPSITYNSGLSADELTLFTGSNETLNGFYKNDLTTATAPSFWMQLYQQIYLANSAIEGLNSSTSLSAGVKEQLLGEAKFIRAFLYFYLVNLYGDVPLVLTSIYKQNSLLARTSASQVWNQIVADLVDAKSLLNSNYVESDVITSKTNTERIRPNKGAAIALLARCYLYTGDFAKSEAEATEILGNTTIYSLSVLNSAFLKNTNNKETIWQLQTVTTGWNTNDARVFILPNTGPNASTYPVYLNKRLVYSFEGGDKRLNNWVTGVKVGIDSFYYAYKYKSATLNASVTEYEIVFRLAEQFLIRAEARAQLNNLMGAQSDLNAIRNRAGLANTTAITKDDLITAVLNERRHELFCEWGHRWLDLNRANKLDDLMNIETPLKGGSWKTTDKFYPISLEEIKANPNLLQTPGY